MNLLYNTGLHLYAAAVRMAAMRNPKAKLMVSGQRATFEQLSRWRQRTGRGFDWWFHAASLGEFEQARPLIERIRAERPGDTILLSFFSPSGYTVRRDYPGADLVVYLPFDTPRASMRFVDLADPARAVFVKYEFWGNYLEQLKRRSIPVYLISAIFRPEQIFFRPWGGTFRAMLGCYEHIFVQDERSKALLAGAGYTDVTIAGDTRYDRVDQIRRQAKAVEAVEHLRNRQPRRRLLVVGSSWPADEKVYLPWLLGRQDLAAVIAPHEFDSRRLDLLLEQLGPEARLMSRYEPADPAPVRYLIVDSFGLLSSIYRYADLAYVGGGFGQGIHNINEAAVYGIPVLFGPRHGKFKEASDLIACGGAFDVTDTASLSAKADRLLDAPGAMQQAGEASARHIASQLGATDTIYDIIKPKIHTDK